MANNSEARALTEQHRREQIALGLEAELEARSEWHRIDVANIDGTSPQWLLAASAGLLWRRRRSAALATGYVAAYREAEVGEAGPVARDMDARRLVEGTLMLAGPIAIKQLIAGGIEPGLAFAQAGRAVAAQAPKLAMSGGRDVVTKSARANRSRWRRVTDGKPCSFCAMLAGRGPVYASDTVLFPLHKGRCGCTAEEVFGEWQPSPLEAKWDQSYMDAFSMIREKRGIYASVNRSNVTRVMRRLNPELFHDGISGLSLAEVRAIA